MPNKKPISRATFEQLHDAIVDKFIQENKVKPSQVLNGSIKQLYCNN
jgi:hypothetical protein